MSAKVAGKFEHAAHTANMWVHEIAKAFPTENRHFAYRVLRAWLHTLRDRLTVEAVAHFAAQLPELVRGVYYEGWDPSKVPERFDRDTYIARFAHEAGISEQDVPRAAKAVTSALLNHVTTGQVDKAFDQLPDSIRSLLQPER
jgi:uncharacterized protein (DUF2267 family)